VRGINYRRFFIVAAVLVIGAGAFFGYRVRRQLAILLAKLPEQWAVPVGDLDVLIAEGLRRPVVTLSDSDQGSSSSDLAH
jgi:hypothetical protein